METVLELYKEMKQESDSISAEKFEAIINEAKKIFPIGSIVNINGTGTIGEVVNYNQRKFGFYPGYLYPVLVRFIHVVNDKHNSTGMTFEFSTDQLKIADQFETAYIDVLLNNPPRSSNDELYMKHYNEWVNL